jgi:catechol 2,3-dioxygenase-like lactoylglutathione lyase family enzyme
MPGRHPIEQQITFLYTRDLAATAHFYEQVLGLPLWLDQGTCRIYHVAGSALLGFCQRDALPASLAGPGEDRLILTLVTPAVDAWYASLSEQGVVFEKPPAVNPRYHIYHCFLRDPNGYLIEIQRFLDAPPLP